MLDTLFKTLLRDDVSVTITTFQGHLGSDSRDYRVPSVRSTDND